VTWSSVGFGSSIFGQQSISRHETNSHLGRKPESRRNPDMRREHHELTTCEWCHAKRILRPELFAINIESHSACRVFGKTSARLSNSTFVACRFATYNAVTYDTFTV
jgi:hypothetical protein